jgi:aspartyl-tRNA(Asn)/glutamyl-tRNA(Gln) amidotransferase subunit A
MHPIHDATVVQLGAALRDKKITAVDATQACLTRAAQTADLGAYLHQDGAGALAAAAAADARRAAGQVLGPWDGIPVALKDIFLTAGLPTTCGSAILKNFIAPYDATVVTRLKAAGAVLLGKLNMDEFAMGSSNEHSAFGPARNPYDRDRVPGGSSGGSATAVACGSAFASLGTDTGGSIRQPAAYTGIVGLKPTYGRVSRYGVIAYASSLDQVGPMTKDVGDCALMLQAIAGADPSDATCARDEVPNFTQNLEAGVKGMRIGVPKEYFTANIDPEVATAVQAALRSYEAMGAKLVDVSLPHTAHGIATYYVLAPAEASSNLARFDGVRYGMRQGGDQGLQEMYMASRSAGFGAEVKRRIMLGTYVLSAGYYEAYYRRAQKARTLVRRDFALAFEQADVLITPTAPGPAFRLGENEADPMKMYMADVFTVSANLAGLPGMSLPCGHTAGGLPIGLQLLAAPWQESRLLQVARAYEREHAWHTRRPPC